MKFLFFLRPCGKNATKLVSSASLPSPQVVLVGALRMLEEREGGRERERKNLKGHRELTTIVCLSERDKLMCLSPILMTMHVTASCSIQPSPPTRVEEEEEKKRMKRGRNSRPSVRWTFSVRTTTEDSSSPLRIPTWINYQCLQRETVPHTKRMDRPKLCCPTRGPPSPHSSSDNARICNAAAREQQLGRLSTFFFSFFFNSSLPSQAFANLFSSTHPLSTSSSRRKKRKMPSPPPLPKSFSPPRSFFSLRGWWVLMTSKKESPPPLSSFGIPGD